MESNTTGSGLSMQYNVLPTKKEIIQRLFTENKITFDEMWVLLQDNENVRFVVMPQPQPVYPFPTLPLYPYNPPWIVTSSNANTITNKIEGNDGN